MIELNKLAFSASITGRDSCGTRCETVWCNDLDDAELVAAFCSLLDVILQDERLKYLFNSAYLALREMYDDGIDSFTFAERKEEQ